MTAIARRVGEMPLIGRARRFVRAFWRAAHPLTEVQQFRKIMCSLPVRAPSAYTFVHLACGDGRTLPLAAEYGFARVIGVEPDPQLAEVAGRNAGAYALVSPTRAGVVEVVRADAASYELPIEPTVVFLLHPFGEEALRAVVDRVEESLVRWPRPFVVAYLNPVHVQVLDGSITLRAVTRKARWIVYEAEAQWREPA